MALILMIFVPIPIMQEVIMQWVLFISSFLISYLFYHLQVTSVYWKIHVSRLILSFSLFISLHYMQISFCSFLFGALAKLCNHVCLSKSKILVRSLFLCCYNLSNIYVALAKVTTYLFYVSLFLCMSSAYILQEHYVIQMFWELIKHFSLENQRKFLK